MVGSGSPFDIATNAMHVVVSSDSFFPFVSVPPHPRLWWFDATGAELATDADTGLNDVRGDGGQVVMGASGRTWWTIRWLDFQLPFVVAIDP